MNMSAEYYGAGSETRANVGKILNLRALRPEDEQAWEFLQADPSRIDEILDLLERKDFDLDLRSALAQLLLASISFAELNWVLSAISVDRAAFYFASDPEVRERMVFLWLGEGRGLQQHALRFALGLDPAPFEHVED